MANEFDPHRLIGSRLGSRFEIASCSASDQVGALYEASDSELLSPASVRVLHSARPDDASLRRLLSLLTEVSNLCLPGFRPLRAVGRTRSQDVYYAVDEVRGRSLAQHIESGPMPPAEAVKLVADAAELVGRAHLHGLVHGSLHPGAILVTRGETDAVTVIDFGLGPLIASDDMLRSSSREAIVPYQSPEQAKGEPLTPRADLYALGALLFTALVGQPPFAGRSALEVLAAQLRGEAPSLADVEASFEGSPLQAVIAQAMQVSPESRFGSAEELAAALRNAGRAEAVRKKPVAGKRPGRPAQAAREPRSDKRPTSPAERKAAERKAAETRFTPALAQRSPWASYLGGGLLVAAAAGLLVYRLAFWTPAGVLTQPGPVAAGQVEGAGGAEGAEGAEKADAGPAPAPGPSTRQKRRPPAEQDAGLNPAIQAALKAQSTPLEPRVLELVSQAQEALSSKRYSTAISRFKAAKRQAPDSAQIARGLGLALMYAGQEDAAASELQRYLELEPTAPDAPVIRATIRNLQQ